MKLKFMKILMCLVLIASMALAPMTAMASSSTMQILKVNTSGARLRDEDKSIITTLRQGTKVFYAGDRIDAYCRVCTLDGEVGYVYKEFLSAYGVVKTKQVYFTTDPSVVYRRSGDSLKRMGTAPENTVVLVLDTNGSWAYVRSLNGATGYMRRNTLQRAF